MPALLASATLPVLAVVPTPAVMLASPALPALSGLPASVALLALADLPVSAAALARLASAVPPPALLGPAVGVSSKGPGPSAPGYPLPSAYGSFPSPIDPI